MSLGQKSKLESYKNRDLAGKPMEWREGAKAAFRAFYAAGTLTEMLQTGRCAEADGPQEFKKMALSPEAEKHSEEMAASLEAAAESRGWTVVYLPPNLVGSLPGSANLSGPIGCIVLGLEKEDGKISPIAIDARTVLFQLESGMMSASRYSGVIDFDRDFRALAPVGLAFI
ncbi:MAG: hypothetical protein AB1324_04625 [Candidatus Micrarchaeota archaeon]